MTDLGLIQKAIDLAKNKNVDEAEAIYLNLLSYEPENFDLLLVIGLFYIEQKRYESAGKYLKKAAAIKQTYGCISAIGIIEFELHNYFDAIKYFQRALQCDSNADKADIYNKLVLSYYELRQYVKAVEYAWQMKELYPEDIRSTINLVKALTQSGKLLEAENICMDFLKQKPTASSVLWFQLGYLKELIYRDDIRAIECYKVSAEYGNQVAYYNIAQCYQNLEEYNKAEEYYKKMLEFFPDDNRTKISLGTCYLAQKRFKEGYELIIERTKDLYIKDCLKNLWSINDELPEEVVVIMEQGFGDQIQFVRYLPILAQKVKNIHIAVQVPLKKLLMQNYPQYNYISFEDINPEMKTIRICDLAYVLNMDFENIPYSSGYLDAESANIESNKLKVGLCWEAGFTGSRTLLNRTIPINFLESIIKLQDVQTYSFQYIDTFDGVMQYPQIIDLAKDFTDFSDTAKALKSMDVVVTVDTALAHLAGSMGIKTCLLLPYNANWRWFGDREKTPWYDSVRIFKQTNSLSWETQVKQVVKVLKSLAESRES